MKNSLKIMLITLTIICISLITANAQWQQTNGPYGGTINCLVNNGKALFAGTNGGLFISYDHGSTWSAHTPGSGTTPSMTINAIQVIDSIVVALTNYGFYYTIDNGSTWNKLDHWTFRNHPPEKIFNIKNNLLIFSADGNNSVVFVTNDSLTFLEPIGNFYNYNIDSTYAQAFEIINTNIFLGSNKGVFMSPDSGKTWDTVSSGLARTNITALVSRENTIFAGTDSGGVFKSTNMGKSWEALNSGLTALSIKTLAVHNDILYAGTNGFGVFVFDNEENTWSLLGNIPPDPFITSISFDGNTILTGTSNKGVFSFNGTWTTSNSGLSGTIIKSFTSIDNNLFAATYGCGVFISKDEGNNWEPVNNGLLNLNVQSLAVKENKLFAGTYGGGIFISEDLGKSWKEINTGITQPYIGSLLVSNGYLFAGTDVPPGLLFGHGRLFLSHDDGNTWQNVLAGVSKIMALASIDNKVFAAGYWGTHASQDDYFTWVSFDSTLDYEESLKWTWSHYISSFGVTGKIIFAGTYGYLIYISKDLGKSWERTRGFWGPYIFDYSLMNNSFAVKDSSIFTSVISRGYPQLRGAGVYKFSFEDSSWVHINSILSDQDTIAHEPVILSTYIKNNTLFAGTNGYGVWKIDISNLTDVNEVRNTKPDTYSLSQNYPNPFNPLTTINYSIPNTSFVTLKVYDILGKEITTLVSEEKPGGNYKVDFNAGNLASGVYFYKIQAGDFSNTKKLILLK